MKFGAVRQDLAAKYGVDVKAILMAAKKRQQRSSHKVVSLVPKKKLSARSGGSVVWRRCLQEIKLPGKG
jgi:arginyl-tRNA synthetase